MGDDVTGDRGFESGSFQQKVSNEPQSFRGRVAPEGPMVRILFPPAASLLRTRLLRRASGTCGRTVIDDDLGKSGTSSDSRGGFQRLIAEIGLGKAGLVSTGESVGSSRCHN
jgi:hypothetical protein